MHVVLLAGGLSKERDVSFTSARSVILALQQLGHVVSQIDADRFVCQKILELRPDIVFNCLHGSFGEDGCIPGMLELIGVPYTHSGVFASSVAMDKTASKYLANLFGIPVPDGVELYTNELFSKIECSIDPIAKPYVIKPVNQGSTIGVNFILDEMSEYPDKDSWQFGDRVIVERYIYGLELSVPVIDGNALGILELRPKSGFYDYNAKYTGGITEHIYPAAIPEEIAEKAKHYAEIMHNKLRCRTLSRCDFRYDVDKNELFFLEINTHPGLTELSILPEVASYNGISMLDIVSLLLKEARCEVKV